MANFWIDFSTAVPMPAETAEMVIEVLNQLKEWDMESEPAPALASIFDYGIDCRYEFGQDEFGDPALCFYTEESGTPEHVADLVTYLIRQGTIELARPFRMQWAAHCSRPILDGFGGGAVVVFPSGEQRWLNTADWMYEQEE